MDGRLFLVTARFLHDQGSEEADFRSAVSRAYYACFLLYREMIFNVCLEEWQERGKRSKKAIKHYYVPNCLINSDNADIRRIGKEFESLQTKRKNADYEMSLNFNQTDAEEAIQLADIMIAELPRLDSEVIRDSTSKYIPTIYD